MSMTPEGIVLTAAAAGAVLYLLGLVRDGVRKLDAINRTVDAVQELQREVAQLRADFDQHITRRSA